MSTTSKYGFKVSKDQFGQSVRSDYVDAGEQTIIDVFEREILLLKGLNKPQYSMVELGANQSYYSLLFHHIIGKDKALNIMIEPFSTHVERGKEQFALNGCKGIWYQRGIGTTRNCGTQILPTGVSPITLHEVLKDNSLDTIDCLHCDIDGPEFEMLTENQDLFEAGKVGVAFILTHDDRDEKKQIHNNCKKFFEPLLYDLVYEEREFGIPSHTTDRVLVYRKK